MKFNLNENIKIKLLSIFLYSIFFTFTITNVYQIYERSSSAFRTLFSATLIARNIKVRIIRDACVKYRC